MKRPLFSVCLFLLAVITLLTLFGAYDTDKNIRLLPENRQKINITCRVCKTDSSGYYVNTIQFPDSDRVALPKEYIFYVPYDNTAGYELPLTGNRLSICATFRQYPHATNPGEFDSYDYYSALNIYGSLSDVALTVTDGSCNPVIHMLDCIKSSGTASVAGQYNETDASVMNNLLFGDKAGLDSEIKELYQRNGISHILSISSLHISIIGLGLFSLLKKMQCPPWLAAIVSAVMLILFGLMTGMSVSAMRAIGIYLIGMFAILVGRTTDRLTSIALVAVILLIINPRQLTACGFLLSFTSVLGICCLFPVLKKIIPGHDTDKIRYTPDTRQNRIKKKIRRLASKVFDSLLAGLSISLTTLPVQLYFFYEIPTYSSLINLMVIPLLSALMILGYLSALFPFLHVPALICTLILRFYELLGKAFNQLPFHSWNPGRPAPGLIIAYYMFWLSIVLLPGYTRFLQPLLSNRITGLLLKLLSPAGLILFIILFSMHRLPTNSIIFMNIGQGDCILVYTDSHEVLLFDGGSSSRSSPGKNIIKSTLKYYGFSHITAVYVSHFDNDHINGIAELLENRDTWDMKIDTVYIPDYPGYIDDCGYKQLIFAVNMQRCEVGIQTVSSNDRFYYGSLRLTCLNPDCNYPYEDSNTASMCMLIEFTQSYIKKASAPGSNTLACTSLLLCGDVAGYGEEMLTQKMTGYPPVTLLKVAHHGSKYSTSDSFLDAVSPYYAFISAGANNRYGHPHSDTLARLSAHNCRCYSTPASGAITVTVFKKRLTIREFIQ